MNITLIFYFIFFTALCPIIASERIDVIKLKNGDIYKGQIVKDVPGDYLQLEMKSGLIKMIKYPEIESREVENNIVKEKYRDKNVNDSNFFPTDVKFGISLYNMTFERDIEKPNIYSENGFLPGIFLSVNSNKVYPFFVKIDLRYSIGKSESEFKEPDLPAFKTDWNNQNFKLNFSANYQLSMDEKFMIIPTVGYSYKNNYSENDQTTELGYKDKYTYSMNHIPVGLNFEYLINTDITLNLRFIADIMLSGNDKIWSNKEPSSYNDTTLFSSPEINLTLGNKIGYEINFDISYKVNNNMSLFFNPFIENISFSKSNTVEYEYFYGSNGTKTSVSEPDGNYVNMGFIFGLCYNFN